MGKKVYIKKCKYCKKEFRPYSSLEKYCCLECKISDTNSQNKSKPVKKRTAINKMSARLIVEDREFKANTKAIKDKMMADVGYIYCQDCSTSQSPFFESHHIIFRSEKPRHKYLHHQVNLLICCTECHEEYHLHKGLRNEIVIERGLDDIFGDDVLDK